YCGRGLELPLRTPLPPVIPADPPPAPPGVSNRAPTFGLTITRAGEIGALALPEPLAGTALPAAEPLAGAALPALPAPASAGGAADPLPIAFGVLGLPGTVPPALSANTTVSIRSSA